MKRINESTIWEKLFSIKGLISILVLLLSLLIFLSFKLINLLFFPLRKLGLVNQNFTNGISRSLIGFIDKDTTQIAKIEIIDLSYRQMQSKMTRTIITILGMTIGISAIVFLISIGYGIEQLVISRVATLEELKQADVTIQNGSSLKLNDKSVNELKNLKNIEEVLPLISIVGKINFNGSVTDVASYAVTSDYLTRSAIKPTRGRIFYNNETVIEKVSQNNVKGAEQKIVEFSETVGNVSFYLPSNTILPIHQIATNDSKIIGFTKSTTTVSLGRALVGDKYLNSKYGEMFTGVNDQKFGVWIEASFPLWKRENCNIKKQKLCLEGKYMPLYDNKKVQQTQKGYIKVSDVLIETESFTSNNVLGVNDIENIETITLDEYKPNETNISKRAIKSITAKEAVVNETFLEVNGIAKDDAVGKSFKVTFVLTDELTDEKEQKIESIETEYKIVGVIPNEKSPVFFLPFIDIKSLGVSNYSQIKIITSDQSHLALSRKQIESMGYSTKSVVDTVNQIDTIFVSVRTVLAILGLVALAVASLGMFNTLTVSLLERTHEVGLMKAMGMKSTEIQELFLTESMIMGILGGFSGLVVGFLFGELLSLILSIIAINGGLGYINLTYIPPYFVVVIIALSLAVGLLTGYYPARRATKISALNALRYE